MSDVSKIKIAVLGAGASGLYFVHCLKNECSKLNIKCEITIFEKLSQVGKKLALTGNGKCNFTNTNITNEKYENYYNIDADDDVKINLLNNVFSNFGPSQIQKSFRDIGLPSYEKDSYVYPICNQSKIFRDILYWMVCEYKVNLIENCEIKFVDVDTKNIKYIIDDGAMKRSFDFVVCALGSPAFYTAPSSLKDIFKELDLSIVEFMPALLPIKVKDDKGICKFANGVRTKAKLGFYVNNNLVKEDIGEIQITKDSFSGIVSFNLSSVINRLQLNNKDVKVVIDFLPDYNDSQLRNEIENRKIIFKNRKESEILNGLLNNNLAKAIFYMSDKSIDSLIKNIKYFSICPIKNTNMRDAQCCIGGVAVDELNINTLECIKYKNLYFVGECIDIDGFCGGYNLSFAFASSRLVALSIANKLKTLKNK